MFAKDQIEEIVSLVISTLFSIFAAVVLKQNFKKLAGLKTHPGLYLSWHFNTQITVMIGKRKYEYAKCIHKYIYMIYLRLLPFALSYNLI